MTCVSERSGRASSGMFRALQYAPTSATATAARTSPRLWAENSMMRRIMRASLRRERGERGLQARLGIDQEAGAHHHLLAIVEAGKHLDQIARSVAGGDLARLEAAVAGSHEDHLAVAGVDDRIGRNAQALVRAGVE